MLLVRPAGSNSWEELTSYGQAHSRTKSHLPAYLPCAAGAVWPLGIGCAPEQRDVRSEASACLDSMQASSKAARSRQCLGTTGALPDELLMPMQSSRSRTEAMSASE